jgi:hypothetical protein
MIAPRVRAVLAASAVAMAVVGGTASCATPSDLDAFTSCLDDAGVEYSVQDGAVVVNHYANEGSDDERNAARVCSELVDGR